MAITITKASVRRALEAWFVAARAGQTMGARETAEMSAHEAAAQSSDYFFQLLCDDEDCVPHMTGDVVLDEGSVREFVAGENIAAGQTVIIEPSTGHLVAAVLDEASLEEEPSEFFG
jgi:hypothetical protein